MKNKSGYRSEPPRTRPGQKYPGGKQLRKRLARLKARIEGVANKFNSPMEWNAQKGYTKPGSMQ